MPPRCADVRGRRAGRYTLQLVVNDGFTDSPSDTVLIDTRNSPPLANAGADQTCPSGRWCSSMVAARRCRRRSSDLSWSFVSRPPGSHATLTDDTAPTRRSSGLPAVRRAARCQRRHRGQPPRHRHHRYPEFASDRARGSRPDRCDGATVQLDGRGSSDADHDPLGLRWSFVSRPPGSLATLSDVTAVQPTFVADAIGVYVVQSSSTTGRSTVRRRRSGSRPIQTVNQRHRERGPIRRSRSRNRESQR